MPLAEDVDLAGLAASSQGFTGAELAGLCRWGDHVPWCATKQQGRAVLLSCC
jgi:ATP-dependent Zn protease